MSIDRLKELHKHERASSYTATDPAFEYEVLALQMLPDLLALYDAAQDYFTEDEINGFGLSRKWFDKYHRARDAVKKLNKEQSDNKEGGQAGGEGE